MQPGIASSVTPEGEDWLVRRVAALESEQAQMRSALAGISGLQQQAAFLLSQSVYVDGWPIGSFTTGNCTDSVNGMPYLPWNGSLPSRTLTTSSSGIVMVTVGWEGYVFSKTATGFTDTACYVDLEINGAGHQITDSGSQSRIALVATSGATTYMNGMAAQPVVFTRLKTLEPSTEYEFRVRLGAATNTGTAVEHGHTWMTLTKIGM
jgi:hypothetical protein